MPCKAMPPEREAGRSTDFTILVHPDPIGDSPLTSSLAAAPARHGLRVPVCGKPAARATSQS